MKYSPSENLFYPEHILGRLTGGAPSDLVQISNDEFRIYGLGIPPAGKVRGPVSGRPAWIDAKDPETIEQAASRQRSVIESALIEALADGMVYTMPDGTEEVVQTRAEDEANLLGLAIEARDLRDAGETEAQQIIRVKSNRHYTLTPQQMIDLTDAAKAFKKLQLAHSWARKDEIEAALEASDRAALEAITW